VPKPEIFPPLRILQDVVTEEETPNSTPLWLLLYRLLLVALVAVALAQPLITKPEGTSSAPLTLIIDNGWDGAQNWGALVKDAEARLSDARRQNIDVLLLTAADPDPAATFEPASVALQRIKSVKPRAVPSDHNTVADILGGLDIADSDALWLSGGIDHGDAAALGTALKPARSIERLTPETEQTAIVPGNVEETANGFRAWFHRLRGHGLCGLG